MARMKELEEENCRLKKMYVEERLKAEIVAEALTKNGSAISAAGDGAMGRVGAVSHGQAGVPGIWHWPDLLRIQSEAGRGKQPHCRLAGTADEQSAQLGLRPVLPVSAQRERLQMEPQARLQNLPRTRAEPADQTASSSGAGETAAVDSAEFDQSELVDGLHA